MLLGLLKMDSNMGKEGFFRHFFHTAVRCEDVSSSLPTLLVNEEASSGQN
ncbi:MAG: hypothetical protein ACKVOU_07825 [Cytophagales bacterium]